MKDLNNILVPLNAIIKDPVKRIALSGALNRSGIKTVKKDYTYEVNSQWCKQRTTKVTFVSAAQIELLSQKRLEKYNLIKDTNFKTSYNLYQSIKKQILDFAKKEIR